MSKRYLNINQITITEATKMREALFESAIEEYTEILLCGDELTPIHVIEDKDDYYITDGHHRYQAYTRAKRETIPCFIKPGTLRDAILDSAHANAYHGVKRSRKDKAIAVNALLCDDEWKQWSDSQIAKACCVSDRFVAQQRKLTPNIRGEDTPLERKYTNKYGDTALMNITNTAKANLPKVVENEESTLEETYDPKDDQILELISTINDYQVEIQDLKENIALKKFDGTEEEKQEVKQTIEVLRKDNAAFSTEINTLKSSRNHYMTERNELISQVKYWKKRFEKTEKLLKDSELYEELQNTKNHLKRAKFILSKHGIDINMEGGL